MTENEAIEYLNITKMCAEDGGVGELQRQMCDMAMSALGKMQEYREMEMKLKSVYGDFDGLLSIAVDGLCKHKNVNIWDAIKARLLVDEDVDKWDAYRKIGTVEECREAVEKQKPKRRYIQKSALEKYYHAPECPNCKKELKPRICGYTLSQAIGIYSYCPWCGQNLDGGKESEEE